MRRLWGVLLAALISTGAHAQSTARVGYAADGNGSQPFTYVSSGTPLPVTGSFSAGSFAPGGSFANLTSTASSADAALPTGTTVALFNTGTTAVSCTLTVGAGSSTANKNIIQASSWFAVSVGSNTHYSCINQAGDSASNVVVASGGSGLPAGAGGGGGGSSSNASVGSTGSAVPSSATYVGITSGGNLTGWNGAVTQSGTWNITNISGTVSLPTGAATSANQSTEITSLATIAANTGAAVPAGTNVIGKVGIDQTTFGTTNGVVSAAVNYQEVAASQTATVLQTSTGATGDYLSHCIIYPASTSPGVVTVFDNTNSAANNVIQFPGGASSTSNLVPFVIAVGAKSVNGAWKVTTGASVAVVCVGHFS